MINLTGDNNTHRLLRKIYELERILDDKNQKICILKYINILLKKIANDYYNEAYYDFLSGLLNRRGFFSHINIHNVREYYIALIDIDNFKYINDNYGHKVGDESIKLVSKKLLVFFDDDNNIVSRFGGDEFIILSRNLSSNELLSKLDFFKNNLYISSSNQLNHPITISVGVVICSNQISINDAINLADKALYQSKNSGKNNVTLYNSKFDSII